MPSLWLPLLPVCLAGDAALTAGFFLAAHGWPGPADLWTPAALGLFRTASLDLLLAFCLRLCLVVSLTALAVRVGTPQRCEAPDESSALKGSPEDPDVARQRRREAAEQRRGVVVAGLFLGLTAMSVYTGLKSVTFQYAVEAVQGPLIIALVALINLEFYAAKGLAMALTAEEGHFEPRLHNHPLFFGAAVCVTCEQCSTEPQEGYAYACRACDIFICVSCFRNANCSTCEGLLRSDKGVHAEQQLSNTVYFLRAMRLTLPFFHIVLLAFGCLLIDQGAHLLLPNTQGAILDSVIQGDRNSFTRNVRLYILYTVLLGLFGSVRSLCVTIVGERMSTEVANKLFASILSQDIAFFDGTDTGNLTSRMSCDAAAMVDPMRTFLNILLSNLLLLIGGLVMCFTTSWRLSMVAFTSIGPIMYATQVYAKWSQHISLQIWDSLARASSVATEALTNIRTVRALSTEGKEVEKYKLERTEALSKSITDALAEAGTYAFTNYVDLGAGVLVLWYGGSLVMEKEGLSLGNLITFQLYWNTMSGAWKGLNDIINSFTRAAGAAQRVFALMDLQPDIDPVGGKRLPVVKGEVRLEEVDFVYQMRPDNKVLDGVSLTIHPNTMCALVGRSGGGKSTIVHLLMRFYDPKRGRILLDGHDLCNLNVKWLHDQMGVVAQDTQLFGTTIEQNITYGLESYDRQQMIAAAKLANAHDFIMKFEEGYQARVGERGVRLSGGQKQRIAIARAFLRRPKLLLLDEATSALDTESEGLVQQSIDRLIQALHGGCTVIVVAHRLSTVMNADCIAVVDGGKVVEQGTHEELLAQGGVYAALARRQLQRGRETLADSPDGVDAALETLLTDGSPAPDSASGYSSDSEVP